MHTSTACRRTLESFIFYSLRMPTNLQTCACLGTAARRRPLRCAAVWKWVTRARALLHGMILSPGFGGAGRPENCYDVCAVAREANQGIKPTGRVCLTCQSDCATALRSTTGRQPNKQVFCRCGLRRDAYAVIKKVRENCGVRGTCIGLELRVHSCVMEDC